MQTITVRPDAVRHLLMLPASGAADWPSQLSPANAPLRADRPLLIPHQVQVATI